MNVIRDVLKDSKEASLSLNTFQPLKQEIWKWIKCSVFFSFLTVTVAGDPKKKDGQRNYRKPDYCLYCKTRYNSKISSHYLAVHKDEEKVKRILQWPVGSKERKHRFTLLQNEGNHRHNCQVRIVFLLKISKIFTIRF